MNTRVRLVKTKNGNNIVYQKRWFDPDGHRRSVTLGKVREMTKREALAQCREFEASITKGEQTAYMPQRISLGDFRPMYLERRKQISEGHTRRHKKFPKLAPKTLAKHSVTLRYLAQYFGEHRGMHTITAADAESWIDALESGRVVNTPLTEQTLRGHIRVAKTVWHWAREMARAVSDNPFSGYDSQPLPGSPNHCVSLDDFEKVVKATGDHGWRTLFGLCRLAGLRLEEARTLLWSGKATDSDGVEHQIGVDWDRQRLCLVGNSKTKRVYREVPVCPRLDDILSKAFTAAPEGAMTITGLSPNNLTRNGQRIVRAAGLEPWPKLFQSLRSSCENAWKVAGIAEPTYTAWAGHSAPVSRRHYVSPTPDEFAAVSQPADRT